MTRPYLLALLAGACLALGVGIASVFDDDGPERGGATPGAGGQHAASPERIEALLGEILAELRDGRSRPASTGDVPTLEAAQARPRPEARTSAPEPRAELNPNGPDGGMLPEAARERLAPLDDWDGNDRMRRRWLFTSERRALQWFGAPDHLFATKAGGEVWVYRSVDGREEERTLTFLRGRLIRID